MSITSDELIFAMLDSIMLPIAHVDDAVVRTKAIGMDRRSQLNFATNNGLHASLFAVRDDLCINTTISFVDAEDDGLTSRAASALTFHTPRTEVLRFSIECD